MRRKHFPYVAIFLVLLSIGILAWLFPENKFIQSALVVPVFLFGLQYLKDQVAYEQNLRTQARQFRFAIGAPTHMANKAFDKHIEFCERYYETLRDLLDTLWREAETSEVLNHAQTLSLCRREFAIWLTDDIDNALSKFEHAIRKLGAGARFVETTRNVESYERQRSLVLEKNRKLFSEVLGIEEGEVSKDHAIEAMTKRLRTILGSEELMQLRVYLVKQSMDGLKQRPTQVD